MIQQVLKQIEKHAISWSNFAVAVCVYVISLAFVSRIPAPAFTSQCMYLPGTAKQDIQTASTFLSLLSSLFAFPYIVSYSLLVANSIYAQTITSKLNIPCIKHLYLVSIVYAAAALVENLLIFLAVLITPTYLFLTFASFLGLAKCVLGYAQVFILLALLPVSLKDYLTNLGRDGRQRIKKDE